MASDIDGLRFQRASLRNARIRAMHVAASACDYVWLQAWKRKGGTQLHPNAAHGTLMAYELNPRSQEASDVGGLQAQRAIPI